jgi:hypothetical protein
MQERQRSQARTQQLQEDLARMRSQQEEVRKRMNHRTTAFERHALEQQREIGALRRAVEAAQKKAKELEEEAARQKLALRSKQEEAIAMQRRLKVAESSAPATRRAVPAGATDAGSRSGSAARQRQVPGQITSARVSTAQQQQHQQWVEQQLQVMLQQKEAQSRLAAWQVRSGPGVRSRLHLEADHNPEQHWASGVSKQFIACMACVPSN